MRSRLPSYAARLRSANARDDPNHEWSEGEFVDFLRDWKGNKDGTIEERLRHLNRLQKHPLCPVKVRGTESEIVESFYAFYQHRREVEKCSPAALMNDFRAIRALGAFLRIPDSYWPTRPPMPRRAREVLPRPEDVYALLHAPYARDAAHSYEAALVRYLLVFDFGIGPRFPSEAWALRVQDFDPLAHTVVITEPKKGGGQRRLYVEPEWLCCSPRHASLAQYLQWRAKVDVGGTDAFWLQPDGEPFPSKFALSQWLRRRVQPRYPWYHGYLGRKWSANARLVEWGFDYHRVAQWLGHEKVDMTRREYEHDARLHQKQYGDRWLLRAFRDAGRTTGALKEASRAPPPLLDAMGSARFAPAQQEYGRTRAGRFAPSRAADQASLDPSSPSQSGGVPLAFPAWAPPMVGVGFGG